MVRKMAASFSLLVGISMTGLWLVLLSTAGIPEVQTKPLEISMHIAAEIATAVALIVGGLGILSDQRWAFRVYSISVGMLLYTLIMSPGYFAQQGDWASVAMFAALMVIALAFLVTSFVKHELFSPSR